MNIVDIFEKEGFYDFKLDDPKFLELTEYLDRNNIEYQETFRPDSEDVIIYNPLMKKFHWSWRR